MSVAIHKQRGVDPNHQLWWRKNERSIVAAFAALTLGEKTVGDQELEC